jgi:hypoxanthine-DNA glycosylase
MPGAESLRRGQYYANANNYFWRIAARWTGLDPAASYEDRVAALTRTRIALWDVLASCERDGSSDGKIRNPGANDFRTFFREHAGLRHVFFNGQKAAELFRRLVRPTLGELAAEFSFATLPSTSPAHARLSLEEKARQWEAVFRCAKGAEGPGPQPTLETGRLLLRPFAPDDAPAVQRLVSDFEIARGAAGIPHPYPEGGAAAWIAPQGEAWRKGEAAVFAICRKESGERLGAIGLRLEAEHGRAELGYWIGRPYWRQGYATEAARAVVAFGFDTLGLHRIFAGVFSRNAASAAVLTQCGFRQEGRQRQHVIHWGERLDFDLYGLLRAEWRA